jgi:hypothetical protein
VQESCPTIFNAKFNSWLDGNGVEWDGVEDANN